MARSSILIWTWLTSSRLFTSRRGGTLDAQYLSAIMHISLVVDLAGGTIVSNCTTVVWKGTGVFDMYGYGIPERDQLTDLAAIPHVFLCSCSSSLQLTCLEGTVH